MQTTNPSWGQALPKQLKPELLAVPVDEGFEDFCTPKTRSDYLDAGGKLLSNTIYTFGNSNPGFDSLLLLEPAHSQLAGATQQRGRVALAFAWRFAMPGSPQFDALATVTSKVASWKTQLQLLSHRCGVSADQSVLVYAASKQVRLGNKQEAIAVLKQLEADNVLVLHRSTVSSLLTPTLAGRAFFALELTVEAAWQAAAGASTADSLTTAEVGAAAAVGGAGTGSSSSAE